MYVTSHLKKPASPDCTFARPTARAAGAREGIPDTQYV